MTKPIKPRKVHDMKECISCERYLHLSLFPHERISYSDADEGSGKFGYGDECCHCRDINSEQKMIVKHAKDWAGLKLGALDRAAIEKAREYYPDDLLKEWREMHEKRA